jgi:hypothetical protein
MQLTGGKIDPTIFQRGDDCDMESGEQIQKMAGY